MDATTFAQRLDFALKALSIGRGRLAAEVAVDKSLVTRWLGGTMRPSPHNLERISRVIAMHCPGFSMLDWECDLATLSRRLGVTVPPVAEPSLHITPETGAQMLSTMLSMPFGLIEAAEKETERRGQTYCARWKLTRLSASGRLVYVVERALIRRKGNGLWIDHFAGGHTLSGWLLVLGNRLYAMLADEADDSFGFYLLNGVAGPRAERLDGILTSVGAGRGAEPFSLVAVLERCGELNGVDDIEWASAAEGGLGAVDPDTLDPVIRAGISRDFGPSTVDDGGDAILRIPHDRCLAQGLTIGTPATH